MAKEQKYSVRILDERDVVLYDPEGVPLPTREVMYTTMGMTPSIIRIPQAEYSEELRDKKIREDIERRLTEKPKVVEV